MGSIFLLVGLGSSWLYLEYLRTPERETWAMPESERAPYTVLITAALAGGVAVGFYLFAAVVS